MPASALRHIHLDAQGEEFTEEDLKRIDLVSSFESSLFH